MNLFDIDQLSQQVDDQIIRGRTDDEIVHNLTGFLTDDLYDLISTERQALRETAEESAMTLP